MKTLRSPVNGNIMYAILVLLSLPGLYISACFLLGQLNVYLPAELIIRWSLLFIAFEPAFAFIFTRSKLSVRHMYGWLNLIMFLVTIMLIFAALAEMGAA